MKRLLLILTLIITSFVVNAQTYKIMTYEYSDYIEKDVESVRMYNGPIYRESYLNVDDSKLLVYDGNNNLLFNLYLVYIEDTSLDNNLSCFNAIDIIDKLKYNVIIANDWTCFSISLSDDNHTIIYKINSIDKI